ncbi:FAD-dependent oxidoreductase [Patescibacteria group bacterium]|nr:FAD-dependent oxidoreductase [Patescibacteria group bacterium]MBU1967211.1 FAD-dependent oxidoreductase [Patescibacteria group bacterium]MBU2543157.1 FAD-dependent oxidoreductase [Patescibacteria group bacterium]
MHKYIAKLEEKLQHNVKYTQFSFELIKPQHLEFQAGQYVSLKVSNKGERRSYSICSTPDNQHQFDLILDLSPGGLGSQFLQQLEFGEEVEVLAPMGQFLVPEDLPADHLVFVATGSGIAPFKAMIEDQLRNKQDQRQITLHWGMRHPEDLFWLDEWEKLDETFINFHFHPVLSQAPPAWTLCRGRVIDCLSIHARPANAAYFLCGNQTMIADVSRLLIGQGVGKELILTEKFY